MKDTNNMLVNRAWARDGSQVITGQALVLGCLLKVRGDRKDDSKVNELLKIMGDKNV